MVPTSLNVGPLLGGTTHSGTHLTPSPYAHTPMTNLLERLGPTDNASCIHLGLYTLDA